MTTRQPPRQPGRSHSLAGKYFTFTLQRESYGIDVLKVREIIRHTTVTAVPQVPAYIRASSTCAGKSSP